MVVFQTAYSTPMDREYTGNHVADVKPSANIEEPIFPVNEIGQTVTEGRQFGTFIQTATAAIRTGAGKIELQPGVGGGEEAAGMENYGKDARETLREVAKVNEVTFTSVHTPAGSVANLSGFNPQQGSFSDEFRKKEFVIPCFFRVHVHFVRVQPLSTVTDHYVLVLLRNQRFHPSHGG